MPSAFRVRAGGRAAVVILFLSQLGLVGLGCSSGDRPIDIRGKVTFQGEPVTEGTVQFNDEKTGRGAQVELGPDGSYQATLHPAEYAVVILPPLQMVESPYGPPDPRFKKVRNIPEKYRSTATSGLSVSVSADRTVHDFEMKP
jgi:hypothetical protein